MQRGPDAAVAEPRTDAADRILGIDATGIGARASGAWTAILATTSSRIMVWVAGVIAVSKFGAIAFPSGLTVPGLTSGLGTVADRLAAPVARWDASWYLLIARYGYQPGPQPHLRVAFFPLYPLLIRVLGWSGMPLVVAGVVISTVSLGLALYWLEALIRLEGAISPRWRHPDAGLLAVLCLAFCPMAVFFSGVYSDSLYLALSVGAFLYARRGRWAVAGVLGGLAAASRPTGVLLMLPLVVLYLYGPRADRAPDTGPRVDRAPDTGPRVDRASDTPPRRSLWPRYRIRLDVAWIALVPIGLLGFLAYLGLQGADPLAPFHVEKAWGHHFTSPFAGVWDGARSAFHDLRHLLSGQAHLKFFSSDPQSGVITGWQNLMPFAFLLLAVPALIGVARRLPIAYFLYTLAALAAALAEPVGLRPLQSLPRYEAVLFPLFMWAGLALARHRNWRIPVLGTSALLAMLFAAEFATWHFVA
jgi:hypothetical protein